MTEKNTENKEDISFNEFKTWLTGLIRGKRGQLPDLKDWKQIKIMLDKVVSVPQADILSSPIIPNENQWITNPPPFAPYSLWNDSTNYHTDNYRWICITNNLHNSEVSSTNQVAISYNDMKIENLNPSQELNIAIDDFIKAQEAKA